MVFEPQKQGNLHKMNLENLEDQEVACIVSSEEDKWVWQRKLGYVFLNTITNIVKHDLIRGLPKLSFKVIFKESN